MRICLNSSNSRRPSSSKALTSTWTRSHLSKVKTFFTNPTRYLVTPNKYMFRVSETSPRRRGQRVRRSGHQKADRNFGREDSRADERRRRSLSHAHRQCGKKRHNLCMDSKKHHRILINVIFRLPSPAAAPSP